MFIDYLTLVMINLVAGTALLAYYLWKGLDETDQRPYASAFGIIGLLGLVLGLQISFTWPLPGSYNIGYGEATALFGAVFLATAISLSQGWSLVPVSIFAFFAGIDAALIGARILSLGLTQEPLLAAVGFVLAGLGGIGSPFFLIWFRNNKIARWIGILLLIAATLLWAFTYYNALWAHLSSFSKWVPAAMNAGQ